MIQIFTDTSANLPAAYIQKYSLRVIPLTYFVDGAEAHQDPAVDFDGKAYYDAMRSGTPVSTAMINLAAFLEPLHAALAAGDDVIYIGMSGGISGTAHAAAMAVQELQEEFPERKIAAIDTYAASLGEGCWCSRLRVCSKTVHPSRSSWSRSPNAAALCASTSRLMTSPISSAAAA